MTSQGTHLKAKQTNSSSGRIHSFKLQLQYEYKVYTYIYIYKIVAEQIFQQKKHHTQTKRSTIFMNLTGTMMFARHVALGQCCNAVRTFSVLIPNGSSSSGERGGGTVTAIGTSALLGAAVAFACTRDNTSLEEARYQTLPEQKYPSPEASPMHGKVSHHSDYNDPPPRPDLPTLTLEDVAEHNNESSMWFTFRGAVYNMTFFIDGHPGGSTVSHCDSFPFTKPLQN